MLIPGQSQDYPVETESSRETSPAGSTASTWVNLDSDSSRQEGSGDNGFASKPADMQAKIKQLEKTVAAFQAQLTSHPQSSTAKVMDFNAFVELIRVNIPTEVLVETHSPRKRGSGEASGVFEPQSEPIQQLPWHADAVRAFEGCAHEVSHPTTQTKKDKPSLWMGKYLKPSKLAHTRTTYFRPEGESSTIFPARANANLSDVSDGPIKDKCSVNLLERDTEVTEALCRPLDDFGSEMGATQCFCNHTANLD